MIIVKLFIMTFLITLVFGLWYHFHNPNFFWLLPGALFVIWGLVELGYRQSRKQLR